MDIRKIMTLCAGCVPSHNSCMPMQSTNSQSWYTDSSETLAEDGGICLADYSPNGEFLSAFSDVTISNTGSVCSSNSSSPRSTLSSQSSISSNEALAEKVSIFSFDVTSDTPSFVGDIDKLSFSSLTSNEAEAVTYSSNSYEWCPTSCNNQESLKSFAESTCGGEGLAALSDEEQRSSEDSELIDSLDILSTSSSGNITTKDSLSL